jgi:galactose-1-phosphate uridylyltransferase
MLNWDPKKLQARGIGSFGTVLAFATAHEEQGRSTLHSHWQIWTEDLSTQIHEDLWNSDRNTHKTSREAFY